MAEIATLTQPVVVSDPPYSFSTIIPNRFPTPPRAIAFLGESQDFEWQADGLGPPYFIVGAVYPETKYLEPTVGQIWPR